MNIDSSLHCKFYVVRKHRYCRMTLKPGEEYCGEHKPVDTNVETEPKQNDDKRRVVCPLDRKHTCFANKLEKHLKVCNAKQDNLPEYITKNINSNQPVGLSTTEDTSNVRMLSLVDPQLLTHIIQKVDEIFKAHDIWTCVVNEVEPTNTSGIDINDSQGVTTRKHLLQTASLLNLLKKNDLIKDDTVFIEFGAGKGKLSYFLAKCTSHLNNSTILLVDRASHRHKMDNKLRNEDDSNRSTATMRIRADIGDLNLNKVPIIARMKHLVGVTKHLCGNATDLALSCLNNFNSQQTRLNGLVMASCCHHRCLWNDYCGKEFFQSCGITSNEFDIMCGLVSWWTCGFKQQINDSNAESNRSNLSNNEKIEIGRKCKLLIDYGRLRFLETFKDPLKCKLVFYVDTDTTLENLAIVCKKTTV